MNASGSIDDPSEGGPGQTDGCPSSNPEPRVDLCQDPAATFRTELQQLIEPIGKALDNQPVGLVLIELTPVDGVLHWDGVRKLVDGEHGPLDRTFELGPNRMAVVKAGLTAPAQAEGYSLRVHEAIRTEHPCRVAIGVAVSRSGDAPSVLLRLAVQALEDALVVGGDTVAVFDDRDRDLHID